VAAYLQAEEGLQSMLAHTHEEFSFVVPAGYEQAFPLFGANEERKWAAGFDPHFIYPSPARDQEGMVFVTEQEGRTRAWTNTVFDSATGQVQYVYFVKDMMVTTIDIHIAEAGAQETRVDVVYERTALSKEANECVSELAIADANGGPMWAKAINRYLANLRSNAEPMPSTP
jgi:hypothetical protein